MIQQQKVRTIFLRLAIACSTFALGFCAHALLISEQSTEIDIPKVSVIATPAPIPNLPTRETFVEPTREPPPMPFDPSGDYHPRNAVTVDSERFVQFVLETTRRRQKLVGSGYVSSVSTAYKFASVVVTKKHLKFRTQKIKGVYYTFDGRFRGNGNFSEQYSGYDGSIMLEGTLQKFVNGQKVFEINTPWVHYAGC